MAFGIELEMRDMLKENKAAEKLALNILRKAMDYFYRNYSLEWFNNGEATTATLVPTPSRRALIFYPYPASPSSRLHRAAC